MEALVDCDWALVHLPDPAPRHAVEHDRRRVLEPQRPHRECGEGAGGCRGIGNVGHGTPLFSPIGILLPSY
jgi:hypothetical protein